MWISVYAIIEKHPKSEIVYSLAESRLYMFSGEIKLPEYEAPCDWHIEDNKKDCEECNGSGVIKTTLNPLFKYDFFQMGDQMLNLTLEDSSHEFRTLKLNGEETDILTTCQFLKLGVIPHGLITPEIHYYDEYSNEDIDWEDRAIEILKKYPNHYIVPASCHI